MAIKTASLSAAVYSGAYECAGEIRIRARISLLFSIEPAICADYDIFSEKP